MKPPGGQPPPGTDSSERCLKADDFPPKPSFPPHLLERPGPSRVRLSARSPQRCPPHSLIPPFLHYSPVFKERSGFHDSTVCDLQVNGKCCERWRGAGASPPTQRRGRGRAAARRCCAGRGAEHPASPPRDPLGPRAL